jgi:hypothetical protein
MIGLLLFAKFPTRPSTSPPPPPIPGLNDTMPRNTWWSLLGLALIVAVVSLGLLLAPGLDQGVATRAVGHHGFFTGRQWIDLAVSMLGFGMVVCAGAVLFATRDRAEKAAETVAGPAAL